MGRPASATATVAVDRQRAAAFAAVVGDRAWDHRSGTAPSLFALAVQLPALAAALDDPAVAVDRSVLLHAEQRATVARPLRLGAPAAVAADAVAAYRYGAGPAVQVGVTVTGPHGQPAADLTTVVRVAGTALPVAAEPPAPSPRPARGELLGRRVVVVGADLIAAYAAAAGDGTALHVDPAAATAAGLDGIVAHGNLVLALAACAAAGDATVRAVAGRFSRPVPAGTEVELAWYRCDRPGVMVLGATTADGPALRHAWAGVGTGGATA